jgi:hypothetical protein
VLGQAQLRAGDIQSGREHLESARALFSDLGMGYWLKGVDTEADGA